MKRITFRYKDSTYRQMKEEAEALNMEFPDYMREAIKTGRREQGKISRRALAVCTAIISVAATISTLCVGTVIKYKVDNRIHYLAVTGQAEASQTTGLYTELLDIDNFNATAWSALDEQELYFTNAAEKIINGRATEIVVNSKEEAQDFSNFFGDTYGLVFRNSADYSFNYYINEDGTYTVGYNKDEVDKSREETAARRVAIMQAMIDKYKLHDYENAYEEVQSITDRIHEKLVYNLDNVKASSYEALQTGEGVCTHFSTAFYVIANAEEIPTELVVGKYYQDNGEFEWHSWCEVHLDGVTYTVDPTGAGFVNEADMWRYEAV